MKNDINRKLSGGCAPKQKTSFSIASEKMRRWASLYASIISDYLKKFLFLYSHLFGHTENLKQRLRAHNSGNSKFTKSYCPWELVMFLGFKDKLKATAFEKYLKSGSGSSFAKKRFW